MKKYLTRAQRKLLPLINPETNTVWQDISNQKIDHFGGTTAVARIFGIAPASVSGWRVNGMPRVRWMMLDILDRYNDEDRARRHPHKKDARYLNAFKHNPETEQS